MVDPSRIFVCNFQHSTTSDELKELFSVAGGVKHILICTEKDTEKPKGYGFVQMESAEAAQLAIQKLDGREVDGRIIRVAIAKERPSRVE
jgi:RNA recognition motif-containing protein